MTGFQALMAFAESARQGSFAAAARQLGVSASAVAKSVARLEADLGLRLFHRTTRVVSLTSDGQELYARCQRVLHEIDALRVQAEGARAEPAGLLRLSLPVVWGRRVVVPVLVLAQLAARWPRLSFEVELSDRYVDVVRERVDAVLRVGTLADSSLVARRVAWQQLVVAASPAYLAARGTPARPGEVVQHDCVVYRNPSAGRLRPWQFREGRRDTEYQPPTRIVLGDGEALVRAAVEGMGLCQVPGNMVADELAAGRLVEVLRPHRPAAMPISVVYPSQRQVPPRLLTFIEALARACEPDALPAAPAPGARRKR